MAKLLVRSRDGENVHRYMDGDVVAVLPDDHVFGRMESLDVWLSEGLAEVDWPGGFVVVHMDGLSVEDAQKYLEPITLAGAAEPVMAVRRMHRLDYNALERRLPESGRDTLRTHARIKRDWSEVAKHMKTKA